MFASVFCTSCSPDIIIDSSSLAQHNSHLQAVFDRLRKAGLTINMEKCQFFRSYLKFLGIRLWCWSGWGETAAIQDFLVPQNSREVNRFLGMASLYHRFVQNFSLIATDVDIKLPNSIWYLEALHQVWVILTSPYHLEYTLMPVRLG